MKVIIFDTETTGLMLPSSAPLEKQPRIIELGCVVVVDGGEPTKHNWLINPGQQISAEITKITGLKNEDLVHQPTFGQQLGEIEDVFAHSDFGIAHNAPFDVGMLTTELTLMGRTGFPWPKLQLCSAQEYTPVMGYRPSLKDLYLRIVGSKLEQTHRACDDAMAVYDLLLKDGFLAQLEAM